MDFLEDIMEYMEQQEAPRTTVLSATLLTPIPPIIEWLTDKSPDSAGTETPIFATLRTPIPEIFALLSPNMHHTKESVEVYAASMMQGPLVDPSVNVTLLNPPDTSPFGMHLQMQQLQLQGNNDGKGYCKQPHEDEQENSFFNRSRESSLSTDYCIPSPPRYHHSQHNLYRPLMHGTTIVHSSSTDSVNSPALPAIRKRGNTSPDRNYSDVRKFHCRWKDCDKSYLRQCHLKQHMRDHTGEKPYKCSFPECDSSFKRSDECKRHEVRRHYDIKPYVCEICGHRSRRIDHYRNHAKQHPM